jgi:hypothetical protein
MVELLCYAARGLVRGYIRHSRYIREGKNWGRQMLMGGIETVTRYRLIIMTFQTHNHFAIHYSSLTFIHPYIYGESIVVHDGRLWILYQADVDVDRFDCKFIISRSL